MMGWRLHADKVEGSLIADTTPSSLVNIQHQHKHFDYTVRRSQGKSVSFACREQREKRSKRLGEALTK